MTSWPKLYLLLCFSVVNCSPVSLQVAIFLPTDSTILNSKELVKSTSEAIRDINSCTEVLWNVSMEAIIIPTQESDPYKTLLMFYKHLVFGTNLFAIGGLLDSKLAEIVLPIADKFQIVQVIDTPFSMGGSNFHMRTPLPSLSLHMEAAVHMFIDQQVTRVGIIYENTSLYIRAAADFVSFVKKLQANINTIAITVNSTSIDNTMDQLEHSGAAVFLCLVPPVFGSQMVSRAEQRELKYTWILVDHMHNRSTQVYNLRSNCTLIIYGAIMEYHSTFSNSKLCQRTSGFSIQDFMFQSLSLTLNSSKQLLQTLPVSGKNITHYMKTRNVPQTQLPYIKCSSNFGAKIEFYSSFKKHLGFFNVQTKHISINKTFYFPCNRNTTRLYITFPPPLIGLTLTFTCLCIIMTTVILCLYFLFRKEPEVKASSFRLSLFVLLGCYSVLIGAMFHFIGSSVVARTYEGRLAFCSLSIGPVALGFDAVLFILMFKALRVYRIFFCNGQMGNHWRDYSLLGYTAILLLVKIFLLAIWAGVDPYILRDNEFTTEEGLLVATQQCRSEHQSIWLVVLFCYIAAPGAVLICLSIKSRKIKQENFKDTKKVSILISSWLYLAVVCTSLWGILRLVESSNIASKIVIGISYCLGAVLTEVFLFLPKILPPLLRYYRIK